MPGEGANYSTTADITTYTKMNVVDGECDDGIEDRYKPKNLPTYPYNKEIVISGCASRLPACSNIAEFSHNLYNKKHMVSTTEKAVRYEEGYVNAPVHLGAMPDIDKYDASFFEMEKWMASTCDPQLRMFLERTYEAIVDAGESLESMRGSRTGVFIGSLPSDSSEVGRTEERMNSYSAFGYAHYHLANRINHFFDFKGPGMASDSACSSALAALESAIMQIRMGYLDYALVGATNLVMDPYASLTAVVVGMLCYDGKCKAFDTKANGFSRADGNMMLFISKKELAKRAYCTVLHVRGNSDGFTKEGLAVPSGESQSQLLKNMYNDLGMDPNEVTYAEAHGPGTAVGDGIEGDAIAAVLCSNRKTPLLLGTVKTNMGHCEGSAGMASIIKTIIACEKKLLPPNLHYEQPNPNIKCLFDGRVKVITEATPFEKGIASVSSFGVGGTNYNGVFRPYKNENRPPHPASKTPRLFVYGSRSQETAKNVLDEVKQHSHSVEYQALLESSSNMPYCKSPYRVYTVFNTTTGKYEGFKKQNAEKRPVWLSFSGMGSQWGGMGRQMMELGPFKESILKSSSYLKKYNFDLHDVIMNGKGDTYSDPAMAFVGITAISMALYDCLEVMGLKPDGIFGHAVGELACAYVDGSMTAGEVIQLAYWYGQAAQKGFSSAGKMLAVGLNLEQAKAVCPAGCHVASHNAESSVTITGPAETMTQLSLKLQAKGVFVKELKSFGRAFQGPACKALVPMIEKELKGVVTPKKRSAKWLSTSVPEAEWENRAEFASLEYFYNNIMSPVLYHNVAKKIPKDAVVIEVSPNPLCQSVLKRTVGSDAKILSLMKEGHKNNVEYFLDQMGQAYIHGVDVYPLRLYPKVQFPVPKGTPHISPLINKTWDHSVSLPIYKAEEDRRRLKGKERFWEFDLDKNEDRYLKGHVVNGEVLFPPSAGLILAWKTLAKIKNKNFEDISVIFKEIKFLDHYRMPDEGNTVIKCRIATNGSFEVSQVENFKISKTHVPEVSLVRGFIYCPEDAKTIELLKAPNMPEAVNLQEDQLSMSKEEIFRSLKTLGWESAEDFRGILRAKHDFSQADLLWTGNWITNLDNIFHCVIQSKGLQSFSPLASIATLQMDPEIHWETADTTEEGEVVRVRVDPITNITVAGGIIIQKAEIVPMEVAPQHDPYLCDKSVFVPYNDTTVVTNTKTQQYASDCAEFCVAGLSRLLVQNGKNGKSFKKGDVMAAIGHEKYNTAIDGRLSKYLQDPRCGLARVLKKIFRTQNGNDFDRNVTKILESNKSELSSDMIWSRLSENDVLQPAIEIVLDNIASNKMNVLEINAGKSMIYKKVLESVKRNPLKTVTYTVADTHDLTDVEKEFEVKYLNWDFSSPKYEHSETHDLIIAKNVLHKQSDIKSALDKLSTALEKGGFVLVQEVTKNFPVALTVEHLEENLPEYQDQRDNGRFLSESSWISKFGKSGFEIVYSRSDGVLSTLFLLKKTKKELGSTFLVNLTNSDGNWLSDIQEKYKEVMGSSDDNARLWICSDSFVTGVTGFFKTLCLESGAKAHRLKCIVKGNINANSQAVNISPGGKEFKRLMTLDLAVNEYRDGVWGFESSLAASTDIKSIDTSCTGAQLTMDTVGDFNSFRYQQMEPPRRDQNKRESNSAYVYYTGINPKDVAYSTCTGDKVKKSGHQLEFGSDFVGRDKAGNRIMGYGVKTMATEVDLTKASCTPIPDSVSMKDASTILTAYGTSLFALKVKSNISAGQTILIHEGAGTVGQAAIAISLSNSLEVFTTVSSEKQRRFILQKFPLIDNDHIASHQGLVFEGQILKVTNGRGVDVVLNSLTGDKAVAGLRLVTKGGKFIDLVQDRKPSTVSMNFSRYMAGKSIMSLDFAKTMTNPLRVHERTAVFNLLKEGLENNEIKPLESTVFDAVHVEKAFSFATLEDNTNMAVIKFRDEEQTLNAVPKAVELPSTPRTYCDPDKSYLVVGGLGGFGLEFADWLVERGCVKLVLTDNKGIESGYQKRRISLWEKNGVKVLTSTETCSTLESTKKTVTLAQTLGPLGGVFLTTKVEDEKSLQDKSPETFKSALKYKIHPITNLDAVTRQHQQQSCLDMFVAFTSLVGGRGQEGMTSSAFANAFVDRVCKKRAFDGLPARSIQLGAIADTVHLSDSWQTDDKQVCGTHPQQIKSVWKSLDLLMDNPNAVTSTYVLPRPETEDGDKGFRGTKLQLIVASECGMRDFMDYDPNITLADIGIDSIMGTQIKDILEEKYQVSYAPADIPLLTIDDLAKIDEKAGSD